MLPIFVYADILSLSLADTGTIIAPGKQVLSVAMEKPTFALLKDATLKLTINGSAHFSDGTKLINETFASIEGDFLKDYNIELEQTDKISSVISVKAELSYFESKKRYLIFGDRIKTEEPISEEEEVSFTAVYTEAAPLENELATCRAEKETLQNQIGVIQQEKQAMAKTVEELKSENENLKKYRTRFYIVISLIILALITTATYVWYAKFKK